MSIKHAVSLRASLDQCDAILREYFDQSGPLAVAFGCQELLNRWRDDKEADFLREIADSPGRQMAVAAIVRCMCEYLQGELERVDA